MITDKTNEHGPETERVLGRALRGRCPSRGGPPHASQIIIAYTPRWLVDAAQEYMRESYAAQQAEPQKSGNDSRSATDTAL